MSASKFTGVVERLKSSVKGRVVGAGDAGYDEARAIWNAGADAKPAAVAYCGSVADVQHALAAAREEGVPIAVRSGAHSVAGFSTCDDGVIIDLSSMKSIDVDSGASTARAGAGVLLGELDAAMQEHGLATTLGIMSNVGITGLTLGGGLGWLMRKHGLACDNLRSIELVTADGNVVTASEDENADLLWGLKGGGGNFGIATTLEYRLHKVGPTVAGGLVAWEPEKRRDLLHYYREFAAAAPEDLCIAAAFTCGPDGAPLAALAGCHAGDVADGQRLLAPARTAVGTPVLDAIGPLPYVDQQKLLDGAYPLGQFHYWRSAFIDELTDDAIDVIVDSFPASPAPPLMEMALEHMGGAVERGDGAFGHRAAKFNVLIGANWIDPADAARCTEWARSTAVAVSPHSRGGGYVNYEPEAGESAVQGAYGDRYARLQALKKKYDPDNLFNRNQNIRPAS